MITGLQLLAHAAVPAVLAFGTPATAGVGIQPGPECAATTVAQGSTYTLPPVQVADTGSGAADISLAVLPVSGRTTLHGRTVTPGWVTFTYPGHWFGMVAGSSVRVAPAETALVPAQLNIPATAPADAYVAWIEPYPAASGKPGLSNIGTGVADLEFTVTRAGTAPRRAVCVTPGVKQASPAKAAALTAHAAAHDPAVKGHLIPANDRKYVPDVIIGALVLGALVVARRTGWL